MNPQPQPESRHRTLQLIWAAVLGSVGIYWFIGIVIASSPRESASPNAAAAIVLSALSVSTYLAVWGLHRRQLVSLEQHIAPTTLQRLSPAVRAALASQLRTTLVICLALLETPSIYALAAYLARLIMFDLFATLIVMSAAFLIAFRVLAFQPAFRILDALQAGP